MYGLPKDIDLGFFVGLEIIQVAIGLNDLVLRFDEPVGDPVFISITSACFYGDGKGKSWDIEKYPQNASLICQLLHHKVEKATANKEGTLALEFDNNVVFIIYDDSLHYESYQIKWPGGDIVV